MRPFGLNNEPTSSFPVAEPKGEFPKILTGLSVEPDLAANGFGFDVLEEKRDGRKKPLEARRLSLLSEPETND